VKVWIKNFKIKNIDNQLTIESMENIFPSQDITLGKRILKEGFWVNKNGNCAGCYFLKDQLRKVIELTLDIIFKNPDKIFKIHKKQIQICNKSFFEGKKIEKLKLENLSEKKLIKLYRLMFKLLGKVNCYAVYSTWFVESDGEDFTKHLLGYIKSKLKKTNFKLSLAKVFSTLTTPERDSLQQKEEKESLRILKLIKSDKAAKKIFLQKNVKDIKKNLNEIGKQLKNKMLSHFRKWRWTPYTYIGPAYNLGHYLEVWSSALKQKKDVEKAINRFQAGNLKIKKQKSELFKKLGIDKKYKKIFDLAAQTVWLKSYRKDALYYNIYVLDLILKELGKRHGFSLMQMKFLAYWELDNLNEVDANELKERMKFSIAYHKNGKLKLLTGKKAENFFKKRLIEKRAIKKTSELRGTPACPGQARGIIKIVNLPEEIKKMKKGDIIVAHTVFPVLMPAIKKASAIITNDGGLTCHAAIVAREMKTPCIVGTKIATKVLKDGDLVEVDAEKGVVRILKK